MSSSLRSEIKVVKRKGARATLHFPEQFFDRISDGFIVYDKEWRYLHVNKQACEILGKRKQDLLGKVLWEIFPEARISETGRYFLRAAETQKPIFFEAHSVIYKKWFGVRVYPNRGGVATFFHDITEQKLAREALLESEQRFRATFYQTTVAMSLADGEANWLLFNKAYTKIFGYSEGELQRMHPKDLIHPEDLEKSRDAFLALLHGETSRLIQERRYIHKNGSIIYGLVNASVVHDSNGYAKYIVTVVEDITKRKQLEQQRTEFLGIASHELKTPVTSLKAFAQLLQRKFAESGDVLAVAMLGKMDAQITRLTNLIRDLLDVSKVEGGRLKMYSRYFAMDDLIKDIVEEIQLTTERHTILIEGKTGMRVYADRERIGQVIINLLTNAVKYSPHSATIIVSTWAEGNEVFVAVEDFGVGIAKKDLPHVFERFFRVSGEIHDTIPGLGLGLHIAFEIIQRHRGRIWVESEEGKKTRFSFALPAEMDVDLFRR